ncbi:hypothetical protein PHET_01527 [Paragonimus heterotremus]|uniref:Uncharacterized protein n=1 Tax=Paragonimus heterotremus TaxID=100268 RepID=A0A8J4T5I9_9TREM|nr:hypothetical protein PHET_01527 [Paragonimus heterotremus]
MINVGVFLQPKFSGAAYAYMTAMSLADAITLLNNLPSGLLSYGGNCEHSNTGKSFLAGFTGLPEPNYLEWVAASYK